MAPVPRSSTTGVVIPIRSFADGMARLADVLTAEVRTALGRDLAHGVVAAAGPMPCVVVSSAPEVREWCDRLGLRAIDDPGSLDLAAAAGREWCARAGLVRVVVAHADLPRITPGGLEQCARDGSAPIVAIAPCHRDDGTPVISLPVDAPFAFGYGPGSFRRHVATARAAGLAVRVLRDPTLAADLDVPADLEAAVHLVASAGALR